MTTLAQYDAARAALAEAVRIDQVLPLRDEVEHIKLYARQIRDRALMADAAEFQLRVERRLGTLIAAAKDAGQIVEGRPRKAAQAPAPENGSGQEPFPRVTLAEAGVDKKLSMTAQKTASISEQAFEAMVQATRERVIAGRAKIIDNGPINGARAVMGSRVEPSDSLDYFPTPPWATRALIEKVMPQLGRRGDLHRQMAWEPACGEGHIAEVLAEYFGEVAASDIHDYGYGDAVLDFLHDGAVPPDADWIITNPPFGDKTEAFVLKAMRLARIGVAMFVRLQWLETVGRYEAIFRDAPPTMIAFFAERVPLCKGRWDPEGDTATAYIWLVWVKGAAPRAPFWIPPGCRESLSRADDVARFTARPVMKALHDVAADEPLPPHDPVTGEIQSSDGGVEGHAGAKNSCSDMPDVFDASPSHPATIAASVSPATGIKPGPSDGMQEIPQEASDTAREALSTGCGTAAETPRVGTQSAPPHTSDDVLDIPAFLRRGPGNCLPNLPTDEARHEVA
jgi:hypothetical protein